MWEFEKFLAMCDHPSGLSFSYNSSFFSGSRQWWFTVWQFDLKRRFSTHQLHGHVDSRHCFVLPVGSLPWCSDSGWVRSAETSLFHLHAFLLEKPVWQQERKYTQQTDVGKRTRDLWRYRSSACRHARKWSNKVQLHMPLDLHLHTEWTLGNYPGKDFFSFWK